MAIVYSLSRSGWSRSTDSSVFLGQKSKDGLKAGALSVKKLRSTPHQDAGCFFQVGRVRVTHTHSTTLDAE
jgi:hypothetical protein